ncbi:MAG: EAL domain-containing protein [Pseudomonadales bacterium]|jgi:diguanylate cyclase (GGDEF)-like protein|nr:EAL domain-containing protein [Pseudomonadales bacterium]
MSSSSTLHVLIADPSANAAEELVRELRNAGHNARGQHAEDSDAFTALLERQRWDLVVVRRDAEMSYDPTALIRQARECDVDLPILLVEDGTELARLTAGIEQGASDVLLAGEDARFMLVVKRELAGLTARRAVQRAEAALAETERRSQLLLDSSSEAIAYVHDGMHVYANRAYAQLFGYDSGEDIEAVPLLDMIAAEYQDTFKQRLKQFDADQPTDGFPISGVRSDRTTFEGEMSLGHAAFDGEPCMQVLIRCTPVRAARIEEAEELRAQDPVTGLTSRPFFLEAVEKRAVLRDKGGKEGAVVIVEIDDFDSVRKNAGMSASDRILKDVADVLAGRASGDVLLARLSDDRFAALIPTTTSGVAEALGEKFRRGIEDLMSTVGGKTTRLTASVGIAMINARTASAQEVLDQAARAVRHVREQDRAGNGVYLFDPADFAQPPPTRIDSSDEEARETLLLLSEGMKSNSLVLLFQPIVSLHGGDEEHYEVYLRLPDRDGNLLPPDDFMHFAEQAGLGGRVDRWVVLHAIKKLAQQRSRGRETRLTINLTHAALTDESFLPWLRVALKAAKLPRDAVILQFTEIAATTYLKQAKAFTEALSQLECRAGVSQFGNSVNPFATLRHLTVDYVKLDGKYVGNIEKDEAAGAELGKTLAELEKLGKTTIVPKVGNPALMAHLFQSGARLVQGNYFGEPTSEMDFDFASEA